MDNNDPGSPLATMVWGLLWGPRVHSGTFHHNSDQLTTTAKLVEPWRVAGFLSSAQHVSLVACFRFLNRGSGVRIPPAPHSSEECASEVAAGRGFPSASLGISAALRQIPPAPHSSEECASEMAVGRGFPSTSLGVCASLRQDLRCAPTNPPSPHPVCDPQSSDVTAAECQSFSPLHRWLGANYKGLGRRRG